MVFYCSSCGELTESTAANYYSLLCESCTYRLFYSPYYNEPSVFEVDQSESTSFLDELLGPSSDKEIESDSKEQLVSICLKLESSTQYLSDRYSHLLCTPPTPEELKPPSKKRAKKNENMQCSNCGTRNTSLWRRDNQGLPICNACGLYYKLHKMHRPPSLQRIETQPRRRRNSLEVLKPVSFNSQEESNFFEPTPNLLEILNQPLDYFTQDDFSQYTCEQDSQETPKKLSPQQNVGYKRSLFSH